MTHPLHMPKVGTVTLHEDTPFDIPQETASAVFTKTVPAGTYDLRLRKYPRHGWKFVVYFPAVVTRDYYENRLFQHRSTREGPTGQATDHAESFDAFWLSQFMKRKGLSVALDWNAIRRPDSVPNASC